MAMKSSRISVVTKRAIEDKLASKNYKKSGVEDHWEKVTDYGRLLITITLKGGSITVCERCQPLREGWSINEFTVDEFLKRDIL